MKIVVLERKSFGYDVSLEGLSKYGEVISYDSASQSEVPELVQDADIVLVNKLQINQQSIGNAKNIKLICEVATGYNNIDISYCKQQNIIVTNVRNYSTPSVAQHTFTLLLSVLERLDYYNQFVKSGTYSGTDTFSHLDEQFYELEGKTYGIMGMGNIGRAVAKIATAFGCKVIYYSASGNTYDVPYEAVNWDTFLKESDIVSIHCPLNEHTAGVINYNALCQMKKNAILINVGRGPIVVEEDLARALDENIIAGAGLDVFQVEPIAANNPLLQIQNQNNLVMTPHIGWGSIEARTRLIKDVENSIEAYLNKTPRSVVTNA